MVMIKHGPKYATLTTGFNGTIFMFSFYGAPKMLQSDNGREFVAAVIDELTKT